METAAGRFSGQKLQQLRLSRGLTQSEMARRAGIREKRVIQFEGGKVADPGIGVLSSLAAVLECDVTAFLGDAEEEDEEADRAVRLRRAASKLVELGYDDLAADVVGAAQVLVGEHRRRAS